MISFTITVHRASAFCLSYLETFLYGHFNAQPTSAKLASKQITTSYPRYQFLASYHSFPAETTLHLTSPNWLDCDSPSGDSTQIFLRSLT